MIEVKNLQTGMTYTEFVQGIKPNIPVWVICTNPSKTELQTIQTTFDIPWEDLEDALDEDERPRLELQPEDPMFIKLVLRVTSIIEDAEASPSHIHPTTLPVVVFLTGDYLITIMSQRFNTKPIKKPIGSRRKRPNPTILVLLDWLESVVKSFELVVDKIDKNLALIEREIFQSIRSSSIEDVFSLSRDATYLDAALKGNLRAFYGLRKAPAFENKPDLLDDLEDLSIDLQQQAELLRIYRELIESSIDGYASVISNNLNYLIKVLTSISLILMVPTLVASLMGMNVVLPFINTDPWSFWIIIIISLILIVPIWVFLKKNDLV
jgi:magnesium transporter